MNLEYHIQKIRNLLRRFPLIQSISNFIYRILLTSEPIRKIKIGYCPICGIKTIMIIDLSNLRGTGFCLFCSANSRHKCIAEIIKRILIIKLIYDDISYIKLIKLINKININNYSLKTILKLFKNEDFWIYEPSSIGPLYNKMKKHPKFLYSEFFPDPDLKGGQFFKGIRFEDLQSLSFDTNSFDIIITQDVLEHVENYSLSFQEIYRVLKPKGVHIFTIPIDNYDKTFQYFDNKGTLLKEKIIFHKGPLRPEGSKVFTQFGYDIINILNKYHFSSFIIHPKVGIFDNIEIIVSIKNI